MKATGIKGKNVKGQTFDIKLKPLAILVGENASGKSAVVDTARVALLGYDLRLGKRPGDTFRLSSGTEMAMGLDFDGGKSNTLSLRMERDSVKSKMQLDVKCPGILLDRNDYLGKSGPERVKYLFKLVGQDLKFDVAELTADFKGIKLDPHTAAHERCIGELCEEVEMLDQDRIEQGQPLDQWFAALLQKIEKRKSDADAVARQMRSALAASVSLEAAKGAPQAIRAGLDTELEQERQFEKGVTSEIQQANSRHNQVQAARKAREDAEKELASHPEQADDTASLREQLRAATAARDAIKLLSQEEREALREKKRKADAKVATLTGQIVAAQALIKSLTATMDKACPNCGATKAHWSETVIADKQAQIDAQNRTLETAQQQQRQEQAILDDVNPKLENIVKALEEYAKLNGPVQTAQTTLDQRLAEIQRVKDLRAAALRRLEATPAQPSDDALAQELAGASAAYKVRGDAGSVLTLELFFEWLQNAQSNARDTIQELEDEKTKAMQQRAALAAREEQKQQAEENEAKSEVYKAAKEKLADKQAKVIESGIKSFMAKASDMLNTVLGHPLEFREGEIGYFRKARWVSHETFSGVEDLLGFGGLCLAFAQDAPCKFIIMDELGRLSKKNKRALLGKVHELIQAGVIDNFLGVDVDADDYGFGADVGLQLIQIDPQ